MHLQAALDILMFNPKALIKFFVIPFLLRFLFLRLVGLGKWSDAVPDVAEASSSSTGSVARCVKCTLGLISLRELWLGRSNFFTLSPCLPFLVLGWIDDPLLGMAMLVGL